MRLRVFVMLRFVFQFTFFYMRFGNFPGFLELIIRLLGIVDTAGNDDFSVLVDGWIGGGLLVGLNPMDFMTAFADGVHDGLESLRTVALGEKVGGRAVFSLRFALESLSVLAEETFFTAICQCDFQSCFYKPPVVRPLRPAPSPEPQNDNGSDMRSLVLMRDN